MSSWFLFTGPERRRAETDHYDSHEENKKIVGRKAVCITHGHVLWVRAFSLSLWSVYNRI
jgi:hypothetical protein